MKSKQSKLRHAFQIAAQKFRAGRMSLVDLLDQFFPITGDGTESRAESDTKQPLQLLSPRAADAHKGDFGHALLIGGSHAMPGAVALAGISALRSGAGLVTVATPAVCQSTVVGLSPCLMMLDLPADADGRLSAEGANRAIEFASRCTAIGLGPGMGRDTGVSQFTRTIYQTITQPVVVDADALNALAETPSELPAAKGPRVLTPHPGEFERLTGVSRSDRDQQVQAAQQLAQKYSIAGNSLVIVLKGHRTLVTDGQRHYTNSSGTPAMATGGSGDVLTGVITALIAQGLSAWDAAALGVFLHGRAGELAATDIGPIGVVATDLVNRLPQAIEKFGLAAE